MKFSPGCFLELRPTVSFFFFLLQLSDAKILRASEYPLVDAVSTLIETGPAPASLLRGSRPAETEFETPSTHLPFANSDFERRLATLYYAGTPCDLDAQCASGYYCNRVYEVCYARLSTGSTCHNSRECPVGDWCNQGGDSWADGVCEPKLAVDDFCNASIPLPSSQCVASLKCENETDACVTADALGDVCTHDEDCNEATQTCTRARFGYHGLTALGLSAEEPPTGEHMIADEPRCLAKGSDLNECTRDADCTTGRCTETGGLPAVGFCFDGSNLPHGVGAVCTFDTDCDDSQGLVCDTVQLKCLYDIGVDCNVKDDCAFDRKCMIGKCVKDPSKWDDCTTFGNVDGNCFSLHEGVKDVIDVFEDHLINIMLKGVAQIPENTDGFSNGFRDVYPFLRMFIDILIDNAISDQSLCYGNFKGTQILEKSQLSDHGCDMIPVMDTKDVNFGVLSYETVIYSSFVEVLRLMGRWIEPYKTQKGDEATDQDIIAGKNVKLKPALCFVYRFPTGNCDDFAVGFGFNIDMVRLIGNLMGPGSTLGEMIVGITKPIMKAGISMKFGFAGAYGNVLETSVRYLSNKEYHWANIPLHVSMVTYADYKIFPDAKWLSLSRKPFQKIADKLMIIDGNYTRAWNLDGTYGALESAVKLMSGKTNDITGDLETLALDLFTFAEVIGINGQISMDLASVSAGILPYITVARIRVDILSFPYSINGVPAGFHFASNFYTDLVDHLCSATRTVSKLIGRGFRCPDFVNNLDLGMSVTDNKIEFHLDVAILKIYCKLTDLIVDIADPKEPKLVCSAGGMIWALIKKGASYIAGKLEEEVFDNVEEAMVEVVAEFEDKAMDVIDETAVALAKLGSKTKKELKKAVVAFFNDPDNVVADVIEDLADELGIGGGGLFRSSEQTDIVASFNFVKQNKCYGGGTVELFNSKDFEESGVDPNGYFAKGFGVTRLDCFRECYEYVANLNATQYNGTLFNAQPCCEYTKMNVNNNNKDYRKCVIGIDGSESASENKQSATLTFMDDFNKMIGLADVGDACTKDYECNLGLCSDGVCVEECTENDRCFPGDNQICYHNDNACLNMGGNYGYCSVYTDQCESCNSSALTLNEGVYYIRTQEGNRYLYMTSSSKGNVLETRSADTWSSVSETEKKKYMFEVHKKSGTDGDAYMLHSVIRDKWFIALDDGTLKGVDDFDPRSTSHYVAIEQKDNCPFFEMFVPDSRDQIYNNDNNNLKAAATAGSSVLFTFEPVSGESFGSLEAIGATCVADSDCTSMFCLDGQCQTACGLHFQCIESQALHHCDVDGHCFADGGMLPYCNPDTNQCEECPMSASPKTDIPEGNYRIRSQDGGLYLNMEDNDATVAKLTLDEEGAAFIWNVVREPDGTFYFENKGRDKVFRINDDGDSTAQSKSGLDDRMRFYIESRGDCDIFKIWNKMGDYVYQADGRGIKGTSHVEFAEFFTFEAMDDAGTTCDNNRDCFSDLCASKTCRVPCDASQTCDASTSNQYCDSHEGCSDGYFCHKSNDNQCEAQRAAEAECNDDDEWCTGVCRSGSCHTDCTTSIVPCIADDHTYCEDDSHCDSSTAYCSSDKKCEAKVAAGKECNRDEKCLSGLCTGDGKFCDGSGYCQCKDETDCRNAVTPCSSGDDVWCELDSNCVGYCNSDFKCTDKESADAECNRDAKCEGFCFKEKCRSGTDCESVENQPCDSGDSYFCTDDNQCSGYCTSENRCADKVGTDVSCNRDGKCTSGICLNSGAATCNDDSCKCFGGTDCRLGANQPCASGDDYFCTDDSQCAGYCTNEYRCADKVAEDASCNRNGKCTTNICVNDKCRSGTDCRVNGPCPDGESNWCEEDYQCDGACFSDFRCDSKVEAGTQCNRDEKCASNLCIGFSFYGDREICDGHSSCTCKDWDDCRTEACSSPYEDGKTWCEADSQCAEGFCNSANYCEDWRAVTSECSRSEQCEEFCFSGKCRSGTDCRVDGPCQDGEDMYCKEDAHCNGFCTSDENCDTKVGADTACNRDEKCLSDMCLAGSGAKCDGGSSCKCADVTDCSSEAAACLSSTDDDWYWCNDDSQCEGYCSSDYSCEDKVDLGVECNRDGKCDSGFCKHGKCLNNCAGACGFGTFNYCEVDSDCDDSLAYCESGGDYYISSFCNHLKLDGETGCSRDEECESKVCRKGMCRSTDCTVDGPCDGELEVNTFDLFYCTEDDHCSGASFCNNNNGCVMDRDATEDCNRDEQCAEDHYCSSSGLCQPDEPDGETCNRPEKCSSGFCESGKCKSDCTDENKGPCATNHQWTYCHVDGDCQNGWCDLSNQALICSDFKSAGDTCKNAVECTDDYCYESLCRVEVCSPDDRCDGEIEATAVNKYFCKYFGLEENVDDDELCKDDSFCNNEYGCVKDRGIGEDCNRDKQCIESAYCNDNGKCEGDESNGSTCNRADKCASGFCIDSKCRANDCTQAPAAGTCGADPWNYCTQDSHCDGSAYCDNNQCTAKKIAGISASETRECLSGLIGGGKCRDRICSASNRCEGEDELTALDAFYCKASSQDEMDLQCTDNSFCNNDNGCVKDRLVNQDCNRDRQCGGDHQTHYCNTGDGKCELKVANGVDCGRDEKCQSGTCINTKCRTDCTKSPYQGTCPPSNYNYCQVDSDCDSTAWCKDEKCFKKCYAHSECESDSWCNNGNKCQLKKGLGESADDDEECISGLARGGKCRATICSTSNRCPGEVESSALDIYYCTDDNQCAENSFCNNDNGCVLDRAINLECNRDEQCGDGYCGSGRCDNRESDGVECNRDIKCASGSCISGKCRTDCTVSPHFGNCGPGQFNYCEQGNNNFDGHCRADSYCTGSNYCDSDEPNGSSCNRASKCAGGVCFGSKCRTDCTIAGNCGPSTWNYCTASSHCNSNSYCDSNQCKAKKGLGESANSNEECLSNLELGGKCRLRSCSSSSKCPGETESGSLYRYYCTDDAHCQDDSFCANDGNGCVKDRGTQASCNRDTQCVSSTYCDSGGNCQNDEDNGTACNRNLKCKSGFCALTKDDKCYTDCRGGNCGANRWHYCTASSDCDSNSYCGSNYCQTKKSLGKSASSSDQCFSGFAAKGRCMTDCRGKDCGASSNNYCTRDTDCRLGTAYCKTGGDNYCQGAKGHLQSCDRDYQCWSNRCGDNSKKCKNP